MNPFITLTFESKKKVRVNINHISSYTRYEKETFIKVGPETLWVSETVEEIDHKISEKYKATTK